MTSDINLESEIASQEAMAIIEKAKEEVATASLKAEEEVALRIQEAKEAGLKKGYEKAEELKTKLANLQNLILSEVKEGVIHAALEVAEAVLNATVNAFPEDTVLFVVQTALGEIPDSTQIWLRVHPADFPVLIKNKQKIIDGLERVKDIDIREDRQVGRGGVLIQTESGVIDAQIKTQIEELALVLGV